MEYILTKEGSTPFFIPVTDPTHSFPPASGEVFFNPRMELNRDATILVLSLIRPEQYLDAMGGTGVRGLRAAHECGLSVTVNDHHPHAVDLIRKNAESLGIDVEITWQEVNSLGSARHFDAIDLDPFGTPAPYIDSLIRSAKRYLFVTATDTAPLCGAHLRAGMRRYFSRPYNTEYHTEVALRTLLGFVCRETIKYDRGIHPLLCYARSHYVRLHLEIRPGAGAADRSLGHIGYIHHCSRCPTRKEQAGIIAETSSCLGCGGKMRAIGPLWLGAISEKPFLARMQEALPTLALHTQNEIHSLLSRCREELDLSYHYEYHTIAKALGRSPPGIEAVLAFLEKEGYRASRTHYSGTSLKTDAPAEVLIRAIGNL
ncbi:MAG: tRNA (guanine(10)-N(2))-dimethyltransferase [Methanomicrobiales archaeon]|nr:tRNA (guanine(10)-N(2))-dimethyltransferase [Methanomicrobiales archaeon]